MVESEAGRGNGDRDDSAAGKPGSGASPQQPDRTDKECRVRSGKNAIPEMTRLKMLPRRNRRGDEGCEREQRSCLLTFQWRVWILKCGRADRNATISPTFQRRAAHNERRTVEHRWKHRASVASTRNSLPVFSFGRNRLPSTEPKVTGSSPVGCTHNAISHNGLWRFHFFGFCIQFVARQGRSLFCVFLTGVCWSGRFGMVVRRRRAAVRRIGNPSYRAAARERVRGRSRLFSPSSGTGSARPVSE